ncbi:MAG TPA: 5'/3'-nucleotidase SurE [Isosphaeraceae bacterium]
MGDGSRVLILTNDDGVDAPGLAALYEAAAGLGHRRVVAPAGPWSGRGHAVTTHGPIRVTPRDGDRRAVDGTPADCVRLALHHLEPTAAWVLAGINAGGNLGADIHHSGTVAAAREAVLHGRPAIALSHYIARGRPLDWSVAARRAARVLRLLLEESWQPGTFWNVNLPHAEPGGPEPEVVLCPVDPSPLPLSFRVEGDVAHYDGDYQRRARVPAADVDVCFGGRIAVSRVPLIPPGDVPS